jgi:lipopolysaccharide/colanic/teichoic acid biosynthesis glycosyltransferase
MDPANTLRSAPEGALPLRQIHAAAAYQYRVAPQALGGPAKRAFDFVAAACGLVLLSPLLLAIALIVKLDSSGPALYRQQRTGFRGRSFSILKFRTMSAMEESARVRQARPGDERVTRVGRVLRRCSLDELPQLVNVLLGEMSLVGPRPHALRHDRDFFVADRQYPRRFLARPGITGLAQISGARGVTETLVQVERRLALDLEYVDQWSFQRDLWILLCTVRVVLGDRDAC